MFKAIGRYLRAFGYLITGRIDAARKELSTNPYVVQATYDSVIEEKTKGNLLVDESTMLANLLHELRMLYVTVNKQQQATTK